MLKFIFSSHAEEEMLRRGIAEETVVQVLRNPEQRASVREGRDLLQSRVSFGEKVYLLRVFVDVDREPAEVVTVYRTSQLTKYWRL